MRFRGERAGPTLSLLHVATNFCGLALLLVYLQLKSIAN